MKGLISQTLDWMTHAAYSEGSVSDWAAGLAVILMLSFLWATVIKQIE
jgi:hypothetical protein